MVYWSALNVIVNQNCFQLNVVLSRRQGCELIETISPVKRPANEFPLVVIFLVLRVDCLWIGLLKFNFVQNLKFKIVCFHLLVNNAINLSSKDIRSILYYFLDQIQI